LGLKGEADVVNWDCIKQGAEEIAKLAPIATAIGAGVAAIIAYCSIRVQRAIARRRASIDFFLKTETDSYMLKAWEEFEAARVAVSRCTDLAEFEKTKQWIDLRSYLNLLS
jgi:hypothetical protein